MRYPKSWLRGLLIALPALLPTAAWAVSGSAVVTDDVTARLVGETTAVSPGQSVWVALELKVREGWHTYWRNPGDSGQATRLAWTLPPGFTAGPIVWATPHRFVVAPLVNYGYSGRVMHLVQITAPRDLEPGSPVTLRARASWLVCADVCIPGEAVVELLMPVSAATGGADPQTAALFSSARADLPAPAPGHAHAAIRKGELVLTLGADWGASLANIAGLSFFPYDDGSIDYAAPQVLTRSAHALELAIKLGDRPPQRGPVQGVLLATAASGSPVDVVPMEIVAPLAEASVAPTNASRAPERHPESSAPGVISLVMLAVLGGLILNLMPCVFPVLSIKAIGLVEQSKKDPRAVRLKGLMFAAGVIGSMLTLAAVLLALRAGGEQIGWGFQLQSPLFVTLMIYLLLAVGLNLSGVFEVGGGLAGLGDGLTQGDGYRAAFFTGVLTTLVATPCTAPFMAAAVGAALTQPPVIALCIFASVGLGLALPYLLLSFAPWTRRALPKPGAWMDTLKQVFAFPMYASAAWLLWVLAQQTSALGLGAALAGAILVALAAWAYQKSKSSGRHGRLTALTAALAALAVALLLPVRFAGVAAAADAGTVARSENPGGSDWQPYDAARVAQLAAAGQPLLVNFTASWCLTCLVNERNAFADAEVQARLRERGVTLMKGDWTNRDPAITQALAAFGRAGVPLYVAYNAQPGSTEPLVLPQLLTANVVNAAFAELPKRNLK